MQEKTFKQLLMSSNYSTLNKQIVKELGIESAFLLTILIEASDGLADNEGWFYQTIEKIGELTGLGRHKQDKIIKELIDLKILEQKNKGVPCKRYFKVNYQMIENLVFQNQQSSLSENGKLDCPKKTNYSVENSQTSLSENGNNKKYIINNLNKELNHKEHNKSCDDYSDDLKAIKEWFKENKIDFSKKHENKIIELLKINSLGYLLKLFQEQIDILKNTVLDSVSQKSNSTSELSLLSGKSRQQMIDLMADYTKAVDSMQSLNKQMMIAKATAPMEAIKAPTPIKYPRISSQDFMTQSEKQLSNLHDQIFEITNITGATLPDNLLAKYHAGDKTVFSKWFVKMITVADKKQIKNLLKTDTIFKSLSIKYVHSFARLISSAEISDNKEMIVSTLLKSDLGQIYTALKEFI